MIYHLVRVILFIVLFLILLFYFHRKQRLSKEIVQRYFFLMVVACLVSFQLPVEQFVLTYPSVEKAFSYRYNPDSLIEVVQNDSTAVVIYTPDNKSISFCSMQKKKNGWKADAFSVFHIYYKSYQKTFLYEVTIPGQSKMFLFVTQPFSIPNVTDNYNSEFKPVTFSLNGVRSDLFYTVISMPNPEYTLTVDGESFRLN